MQLRCDECRERLLDHLYGLLDPAEVAALDNHLVGCPTCTAARAEAARLQGLLAQAAKPVVTDLVFAPPPEAPVEPKRPAEQPRHTVRRTWVTWAVAASLFLMTASLGGPLVRDTLGYLAYKPRVDIAYVAANEARKDRSQADAVLSREQERMEKQVAGLREKHDALRDDWVKVAAASAALAKARPFAVTVNGPSTAVPGAPNEYTLSAKSDKPRAVAFEVAVKDAAGKQLFAQKYEPKDRSPTPEQLVRLPATIWDGATPGTQLSLSVTATDTATKETVTLAEAVKLLEPVYTTVLTTDKPMYRPGETLYFRSLTLDRTRFLPPTRELNLRFELRAPNGQPVTGLNLVGLAKPVVMGITGRTELVRGPDGQPVRGVGTGAFALPRTIAGGVYSLDVYEVPLNELHPSAGTRPLASRKVLVNDYKPDTLEKKLEFDAATYGPGDVVQAKLEVRDQGKPVAGAELTVAVTADGKALKTEVAEKTDAAGNAPLRFTLPTDNDLNAATITVTVSGRGLNETLQKPVPLASRKLHLEFFPEGGDLAAGLPGRVYFRATTHTGKPADITGVLTDGQNTICEIKTLTDPDRPGANQGLGVFEFTPQAGKRYAVRLNRPLAAVPVFFLPSMKKDSVAMAVRTGVTRTGEQVQVQLQSTTKRAVLVGAYTRGRPVAQAKATLEAGKPTDVMLDFGDAKLGGVTRITVFELPDLEAGRADLTPVAERLVFRQPGEALKLTVAPTQSGAFIPGSTVELRVTATDEAGNPKPAILWAAVVNNSVLAMADEKAARSLPTHFLLGGDIRKAEDLEHADFLLTDHPQAKVALDLLLGTQGWRRFAEVSLFQNLKTVDDRDRLTASLTGGPIARADVRRVFDEYWPRYEKAVFDLDTAEADLQSGKALAEPQAAATLAESNFQSKLNALGTAAAELELFDKSMEERRSWLPGTIIFVFGLALMIGALVFAVRRGAPERRPLLVGTIGFALLGLFILVTVGLTTLGDNDWRSLATNAPRPSPYGGYGPTRKAISPAPPLAPGAVTSQADVPPPQPLPTRSAPLVMAKLTVPKVELPPIPKQTVRAVPLPPVYVWRVPATRRLNEEYRDRSKDGQIPDAGLMAIALEAPQNSRPLFVREYAHTRPTPQPGQPVRADFTETLLWQPVIVLPQDGKATLSFDLSDAVNAYQVLVAGHTLDGRLGSTTTLLEVRKPVVVEPKLPQEIGAADKLDVPVVVTNNTPEAQTPAVTLTGTGVAVEATASKFDLELPANGGGRKLVRVTPTIAEGQATVRASSVLTPTVSDAVLRSVTVVPDGFPAMGSASTLLEERARLPITLPPQWDKGSMRAAVTVYPNPLAEVQAGLAGLLREPAGCFEQSSSANYPNVLVLDSLRDAKQADPDASRRARELLDRGYTRLIGFECPKTGGPTRIGYEWFGAADRPHEALTAYGLLQFTDMARVYPVDPDMLKRTKQFLLDSRDGKGGFTRNARAVDKFGRAPDHITNAYIVWAITEAERGVAASDLAQELNALVVQAKDAKDPYFLGLVANALLNRGRQADGVALLKTVAGMQAKDGRVTGAATSITASSGRSLDIETTAFALLGWLKVERAETFAEPVRVAVKWVASQRDGNGSFGATQSTVLALKALLDYARLNNKPAESGTLRVFVGAIEVAKREFNTATPGPIVLEIPDADGTFKPGQTEIRVETTTKQAYPVSVAWNCRTRQPLSADCALKLTTKLSATEADEGAPVRLDVTVENLADRGHGMAVAVIGLPAGLTLPPDAKELKALAEAPADGEPAVSYWEQRGRELVLYWRGLAPKQRTSLSLNLIASYPGEFRGPAGRAYLYYDPDAKHWVEPLAIAVRAKP